MSYQMNHISVQHNQNIPHNSIWMQIYQDCKTIYITQYPIGPIQKTNNYQIKIQTIKKQTHGEICA